MQDDRNCATTVYVNAEMAQRASLVCQAVGLSLTRVARMYLSECARTGKPALPGSDAREGIPREKLMRIPISREERDAARAAMRASGTSMKSGINGDRAWDRKTYSRQRGGGR